MHLNPLVALVVAARQGCCRHEDTLHLPAVAQRLHNQQHHLVHRGHKSDGSGRRVCWPYAYRLLRRKLCAVAIAGADNPQRIQVVGDVRKRISLVEERVMRWTILAAALALSACGGRTHELTYVRASDPVWQINPDRWNATSNDLTAAPTLSSGIAPVATR